MTEKRLKDAFGETPVSVQYRVQNALNGPKEEKIMKKKFSAGLVAAILTLVLLCGAAIAGTEWSVLDFLDWRSGSTETETGKQMAAVVQQVGESYDGAAVRMNVLDALYDNVGKAITLAWTLENKTPGTQYYVLCDGVFIDGKAAFERSARNTTEFMLGDETLECGMTCEAPENGGQNVEMTFTILKPTAEIVNIEGVTEEDDLDAYLAQIAALNAEGKIVMAGDGWVELTEDDWKEDETYCEALTRTGKFETADRFTISFTLRDDSASGLERVYQGETNFVFDGYELRVREAVLTPMTARFVVDYVTDEKPVDGGKGMGPLWEVQFTLGAEGEKWWYTNGGGWWSDEPVQLEDGRWLSTFNCEMIGLLEWPDEVRMELITFEPDGEGYRAVEHTEEAVTLQFN